MIKRSFLVLLIIEVFFITNSHAQTIFIFNPEARVANINKVRTDLENYFKTEKMPANTFIFATPEDFENSIGRLKPDIAVVASYYFYTRKNDYHWTTYLQGQKDGDRMFMKVLVTPKTINNIQDLKNKSIATVSLGFSTANIDSILPRQITTQDIRIVSVSKDIDAIMALAFKQVEAAIVTETSYEKLKEINPDAVTNLKILQKLKPIAYPKVIVFSNTTKTTDYINMFEKMDLDNQASSLLRFLGITGFIKEN